MVSLSAMHCMRSGIRWTSNSTSGNSAFNSSTRGRDLFRMVSRERPLEARCFTSNLDIFPAPMMHTCSRGSQLGPTDLGTVVLHQSHLAAHVWAVYSIVSPVHCVQHDLEPQMLPHELL